MLIGKSNAIKHILCHAYEILYEAHEKICHAHEIISRVHDILRPAHEIIIHAHDIPYYVVFVP